MQVIALELAAILDNELQHYTSYIIADAEVQLLSDNRIKLIATDGRIFYITIEEGGE